MEYKIYLALFVVPADCPITQDLFLSMVTIIITCVKIAQYVQHVHPLVKEDNIYFWGVKCSSTVILHLIRNVYYGFS